MKKLILIYIVMMTLIWGCSSLGDLESKATVVTTNTVTITNVDDYAYTNVTVVTNIIRISDSVYQTNIVEKTTIVWTSTNAIDKRVDNQPVPNEIDIFVDRGAHGAWANPMIYWWYVDGSGNGTVGSPQNINDGRIDWWKFRVTNIDLRKTFGIKLHNNNWANVEPIKTENGSYYDRNIKIPLLGLINETISNTTNVVGMDTIITSYVYTTMRTVSNIFVCSPGQWYESFPYFFESETNLYKNPADVHPSLSNQSPWDWYMGANYWGGGVTVFTFYAPNVRKVWVAGEFTDWNEGKIPMYLTTDKVWWWAVVSNTQPGQMYKFVYEKYPDQWGGPYTNWVSDPASKRNNGGALAESYIVDQDKYQWSSLWDRPSDFIWYSIYQLHIRTFNAPASKTTNWQYDDPDSFWGWGTFRTAVKKFDYIAGMGFTAIEPLPIHEFGGDQSWGYNYTLFYAPESAYCGTNTKDGDNLKYFVDEAHKRGMAVILDLVFNHMGASDDPVGSIDPSVDWNSPNTYWYMYKTDWGPRFNYANPVVDKFLVDSAKYMAQYYRVDGFRFDATYYIAWNNSGNDGGNFLYNMTRKLKAMDGRLILIAENLPTWDWLTTYDGGRFDFQWNVESAHKLKKLFSDGPSALNIDELAGIITWNNAVNYLVSHDECANGKQRTSADLHYSRGWGNSDFDAQYQQLTGLATAIFAKGVPMVFMGDEFLEGFYDDSYWDFPNNRRYFHDDRGLSWNNEYNEHPYLKPSRWRAMKTYWATSNMVKIRKNDISGNKWNTWVCHTRDKILAFGKGDNIFVIINFDKQSHSGYTIDNFPGGSWKRIYQSPSDNYGDSVGWANEWGQPGYIPEYGVIIYKKQ